MIINHMRMGSRALGMQTSVNVLLPDYPQPNLPILLLLHGLGDDENTWLEQTRLTAVIGERQLAVIMPRVDRSYYTDTVASGYFKFVSQELLERCRQVFSLSSLASQTFVGGVSMGGFGALKVALNKPDDFAGVLSFSGVTDLIKQWRLNPDRDDWFKSMYGTQAKMLETIDDLSGLAANWPQNKRKPIVWQFCGQSDPFNKMNAEFHKQLILHQFQTTYLTLPGAHTWSVWNRSLDSAMAFLDNQLFK